MQKFAVIVAGGKGTRMGSTIPKQFLNLSGKTVLMKTMEAFAECGVSIVLVLPPDQKRYWNELCIQFGFTVPHIIADGGNTRSQSVISGLQHVPDDSLVAIHDGVRPCIRKSIIQQSFLTAGEKGNAITAVALKDSIRKQQGENTIAVNRSDYVLVQTPQTFRTKLLKQAYAQAIKSGNEFTDDASVLEVTGETINLIEGSYQNIKITTLEDLSVAEVFLRDTVFK
jgi:2-C-methyl-D-erythritol 4-phosphate cytidylyltransferase